MWLLPTYNRPDRCKETLKSIAAAGPSQGILFVNGGDIESYTDIELPEGWRRTYIKDNIGVCGALNWFFKHYPCEHWYGFITDDSIVRTPNFQAPLVEAAGVSGFANSADGWQAQNRMHGAVVFGGALVRALGWWAPPGLYHCFVDDAWEAIGRALSNWQFVPQVMVEHQHVGNKKAPMDDTYKFAYDRADDDRRIWESLRRSEIPAAIERAIPVVTTDVEKQRLARALSRTVMIATPIARNPCWQYMNAIVDTCTLLQRLGMPYGRQFVIGSSNLPRARNELCARFLASQCTDLLFIDDDMEWTGNDVIRLLASKQMIAGALGRKRVDKPNSDPSVWCGSPHMNGSKLLEQDDMGFVRYDKVGTGFLKIRREALEILIKAHPEWKAAGNPEMADDVKASYYRFFRFGENEFESGEDFEFCNSWTELGGQIWIDAEINLGHVGEKNYKGRISDLMQAMSDESK